MTINALNLITKTSSCSVMGDYAIKHKMTVPYSKAKKGDVVLYDFNRNGTSDHTGIIYKVEGGKIYVVEGNTSTGNNCNGGMVMKRIRTKPVVNYIVRPKYDQVVTADMVVATALSQVGVKESPAGSNKVKYNTWFYGKVVSGSAYPWCMVFVCWCFAHVGIEKEEKKKEEIKSITKPTGKYSGTIPNPTLKKGSGGTRVKDLQKFLNWYGGFKLTTDGEFGAKTEHAVRVFQKTEKITDDGIYGKDSYAKAKAYKKEEPKETTTTATVKTKDQKLEDAINELAWAYGTAEKKWKYSTGSPTAKMKEAMKKLGYKTKVAFSDCGYCVNTALYRAFGVKVKVLGSPKKAFPKVAGTKTVHKGGKIPGGFFKAGCVYIIRYKKTNGAQHVMFKLGTGHIAEGGRKTRFFVIKKDEKKYNKSNVRHSTIEVLRII